MIIKVPLRPYYIGTKGGNTKCSHQCGTPKTTNSAPTVQHTKYGNIATRCHEAQNPSNVLHHSAARICLAAKVVVRDVLDPQIPMGSSGVRRLRTAPIPSVEEVWLPLWWRRRHQGGWPLQPPQVAATIASSLHSILSLSPNQQPLKIRILPKNQ